jgi:MoaA/NifB/PqqE/SkfB family radical SAM enzyme
VKYLLNVELTPDCNAKCITCPREGLPRNVEMSPETFRKLLTRIAEDFRGPNKILSVSFAGRGEPVLNKNFKQFLSEIKRFKAENPDVKVKFNLVTNGQRLSRNLGGGRRDYSLIDEMVGAIDEVKISFGSYVHHSEVHCGLKREIILDNLRYLADNYVKNGKIKASVHITPTEYSCKDRDLEQTLEVLAGIFGKENVRFIVFPFTSNRGGEAPDIPIPLKKQERVISRILSKYSNQGYQISRLEAEFDRPPFSDLLRAIVWDYCVSRGTSLAVRFDGRYAYCFNNWCGKLDGIGRDLSVYDTSFIDAAKIGLAEQNRYFRDNNLPDFCRKCNNLDEYTGWNLVRQMANEAWDKASKLFKNPHYDDGAGMCQ